MSAIYLDTSHCTYHIGLDLLHIVATSEFIRILQQLFHDVNGDPQKRVDERKEVSLTSLDWQCISSSIAALVGTSQP